MTIFVSHVDPHTPNIRYMKVHEGLQALGGISSFFSREISLRMPSESCLGTPSGPRYEHIYKNIHLCKGKGREKCKKGKREKGKGEM